MIKKNNALYTLNVKKSPVFYLKSFPKKKLPSGKTQRNAPNLSEKRHPRQHNLSVNRGGGKFRTLEDTERRGPNGKADGPPMIGPQ